MIYTPDSYHAHERVIGCPACGSYARIGSPGVTIRAEFAARMTAALASTEGVADFTPEMIAKAGVLLADALISVLNATPPEMRK